MEKTRIENTLIHLGVPADLQGFRRLVECIQQYRPGMAITKELYPAIAEKNGVAPKGVERTIRYAIEETWDHGDLDCIHDFFGNSISAITGNPSNSQFIATVKLRLEQEARG